MRYMVGKTAVLAGAVLLVSGCMLTAKAKVNGDTVQKVRARQEYNLQGVGRANKKNIDGALKVYKRNGAGAARYLNKIKGNKRDFEMGIREVLNEYYSMEEAQRAELDNFAQALDGAAETIIEHYEEAEEERKNSENLDYQTEEVMVSFPNGTSEETIEKVVQECALDYEVIDDGEFHMDENLPEYKKKRLEKIKDYKTDVVILAKIGLEDTVARAEEKFEEYGCVVDVTDNTFLEADGTIASESGKLTLSDPKFISDKQWNMVNIDIAGAYRKFNVETVVNEVWVAVIDSGVQMDHPDLKGSVLRNYSVDVTQNNKKLIECPDKEAVKGQYTHGHGTMVAGVIAARANNGKFGAGVAAAATEKNFGVVCKIMAIKCDKTVGEDRHVTKAYLAAAIKYAVDKGAEVINISYSAPKGDYETESFEGVRKAIERAIKADVTVVASAGNDEGSKPRYPAEFPGVIGVGASTSGNKMADFSNRSGAVDILAPVEDANGKGIYCIYPTTIVEGGAILGGKTSCAAPQVAATAAMMKSIQSDLTPDQILTKLKKSSTKSVKVKVGSEVKTFPILNTGKAVQGVKRY